MASVLTRAGDTFENIARRVYGDDLQAAAIRSANPGMEEPFEAGVVLTAPTSTTNAQRSQQRSQADNQDEVAIKINGQRFRFWTTLSVTLSADSVATLAMGAPFDPDDPAFRAVFRPFSFATVEVTVGGAPLFTGTMVDVTPATSEAGRVVAVTCYSLPGVLGDCTAPASMYPVEWDGADLRTVSEALAAPFGLRVVLGSNASQGSVFERVALKPGEMVLPFLVKLAQQRGLITSSTPEGGLLYDVATAPGQPVAILREGGSPVLNIAPTFDPQTYYSDVTGIEPAIVGLKGGKSTSRNSHLQGTLRPFTFEVSDTLDADVGAAVAAKIGRMFAGAVSYSVDVATWRTPSGALWSSNTTVKLEAPGAMVYSEYEFFIRSVTLTRSSDGGEVAKLTLTPPGAFRSEIPESLPWE